jgi:hypothetical protein
MYFFFTNHLTSPRQIDDAKLQQQQMTVSRKDHNSQLRPGSATRPGSRHRAGQQHGLSVAWTLRSDLLPPEAQSTSFHDRPHRMRRTCFRIVFTHHN